MYCLAHFGHSSFFIFICSSFFSPRFVVLGFYFLTFFITFTGLFLVQVSSLLLSEELDKSFQLVCVSRGPQPKNLIKEDPVFCEL